MAGSLSSENEEKLTEVVRRYPVIYDKSEPGHRDNNTVENAWKEVISLVDFVDDTKQAKAFFQNIKKRYCKYRQNLTNADKTGTSLAEKEAAIKSFEPYRYLQWLDTFIAKRESKSNLPRTTASLIMPKPVLQTQPADSHPEETEEALSDTDSEGETESPASTAPALKKPETPPATPASGSKRKCSSRKQTGIKDEDVELNILKDMHEDIKRKRKLMEAAKDREPTQEELFGQMISLELAKFGEYEKAMITHEIRNVLFKYQMAKYNATNTREVPDYVPNNLSAHTWPNANNFSQHDGKSNFY